MREPPAQTKLLASAPVFFGAWGMALWTAYQWTQHPAAWPLVLITGAGVAAVMKADAQVRAYRHWKAEWDAMAGAPPRRAPWLMLLGMALGVPFTVMLFGIGQQSGSQAVLGVLLLILGPLLLLGLLQRLWRALRRRSRTRSARAKPVAVCVRRPLLPVPSLRAAYQALPPYCHDLLRGQS